MQEQNEGNQTALDVKTTSSKLKYSFKKENNKAIPRLVHVSLRFWTNNDGLKRRLAMQTAENVHQFQSISSIKQKLLM